MFVCVCVCVCVFVGEGRLGTRLSGFDKDSIGGKYQQRAVAKPPRYRVAGVAVWKRK